MLRNVKKPFYVFLTFGVVFRVLLSAFIVSNYVKLNNLDSSVLSTYVDVNSYIDDEINRLSGNLSGDYYNSNFVDSSNYYYNSQNN